MYTVFYCNEPFAEFDNDVNACAVALDLHRISNLKHRIFVKTPDSDVIVDFINLVHDGKS